MGREEGLGEVVGFAATLLLGYAIMKALTERQCWTCGASTPKKEPYCRSCGTYLGTGER